MGNEAVKQLKDQAGLLMENKIIFGLAIVKVTLAS